MKASLLTALLTFCCLQFGFAQDIITKRNGDYFNAKILEISTNEIKYKKFDNLEGPIFTMQKSEVMMVQYENKTQEFFEDAVSPATADTYLKGQLDAEHHYRNYTAAGTGTLVASLVSPLLGLIPAVITSSSTPKQTNLNMPNPEVTKSTEYHVGYAAKAKKVKSRKVWTNWGIGLGVNLIAVVLLAQ